MKGIVSLNFLVTGLAVLILVASFNQAKETKNEQPLANLDKIMRQANGVKLDSVMDPKLTSNVTNTLNEMAMNLRKMFMENRRLSSQVQDVLQRMQNATGVNVTNSMNNLQQQATSMNASNINLNNLIPRMQT